MDGIPSVLSVDLTKGLGCRKGASRVDFEKGRAIIEESVGVGIKEVKREEFDDANFEI